MNCEQCDTPLVAGRCPACEAEDRMYAAYAASIEVPALWSAIDARVRQRRAQWIPLAAAILVAVVIAAVVALRGRHRGSSPLDVAAASYRTAIARLEPRATRDVAALLPNMNTAITAAVRAAAARPDDPFAVTNVVAAYDAKLQLLRTNRR